MKMSDSIILLLGALGIAAVAHLLWPATRKYLRTRRAWLAISLGALVLSAASWFVSEEHGGGTLLQLRHGWPKFYSFECLSLECTWSWDVDPIFFLGNSFFYGAGLVLAWTLVVAVLAIRGSGNNNVR